MKQNNPLHYVSVEWLHDFTGEPVHLYYELDAGQCERRKVEMYRDGTLHSADAMHGQGSTFLAWEPHPSLAEIANDPQFRTQEIAEEEFESVWSRARQAERQPVVA